MRVQKQFDKPLLSKDMFEILLEQIEGYKKWENVNTYQYLLSEDRTIHFYMNGNQKVTTFNGKKETIDRIEAVYEFLLQKRFKVFVVYGHDEKSLENLKKFLDEMGIAYDLVTNDNTNGNTVIEEVVEKIDGCQHGIVLMTPDNEVITEKDHSVEIHARMNVLFEAGYIMGKYGRKHVTLLAHENVHIPSDLAGVFRKSFQTNVLDQQAGDNEKQQRQILSEIIKSLHIYYQDENKGE